jgi:predicted Zn-dependent peptidase
MNALLGGSFSSRITSNIRESKGYTYSPASIVSSRYRDAYWVEVADVTTKDTGPALKEIFYEINRLRTEPPSQEELKAIQNYLAGVFVIQNSSPSGIVGQLTFLDLHGLPESYLADAVKNIHAVTPEKVRELAATYLKDEAFTLVVVGDTKKIAGEVRKYVQTVM